VKNKNNEHEPDIETLIWETYDMMMVVRKEGCLIQMIMIKLPLTDTSSELKCQLIKRGINVFALSCWVEVEF
jgi:hypothetical protein